MSFLVRRNKKVLAGWFDTFNRPAENPIKPPWVHLGDGSPATLTGTGSMIIPQNFATTNGGGESYEFQPFTPNSGLDIEFYNPVTGLLGQAFSIYLTDSWAVIGAAFLNCVGIRLIHNPVLGGESIQLNEFANVFATSVPKETFASPVTFNGTLLTLRIWVDDDQLLRLWLNGVYLGSGLISSGYKLGFRRRCVRFLNTNLNGVEIRQIYHYDRPQDLRIGTARWQSLFYDDYNTTSGPVGNGWTVFGAAGQIVGNSYSTTGTTDGGRAILRNTGVTNGRIRVEGVAGGNKPMVAGADSGLLLCCNAAGTQGLSANFTSGGVRIERFSSVLTGNPPTFVTLKNSALSIPTGASLAFCADNGNAWAEVNNEIVCYTDIANTVVPITNPWAGQRVERQSWTDSNSWNDCRILVPV